MSALFNPLSFVVACLSGWFNERQQHAIDYLTEENRVLRKQTRWSSPSFHRRSALSTGCPCQGIKPHCSGPDSNHRHSRNVARLTPQARRGQYDGSAKRGSGRPRTGTDIEALVVRMAEENRTWGYDRIVRALANLGHELSAKTIANILKRHGIEPAPDRQRKTTWKEFVSRHFDQIAATDFFSVEVWIRKGLQRLMVLFFIELSSRRVQLGGLPTSPRPSNNRRSQTPLAFSTVI